MVNADSDDSNREERALRRLPVLAYVKGKCFTVRHLIGNMLPAQEDCGAVSHSTFETRVPLRLDGS
jgi:hypothetical protein